MAVPMKRMDQISNTSIRSSHSARSEVGEDTHVRGGREEVRGVLSSILATLFAIFWASRDFFVCKITVYVLS